MRHWIDLEDDELALLDGKVKNVQAQDIVAKAVARLTMRDQLRGQPEIADFIANVLYAAKSTGKIESRTASFHKCPICGGGGEYYKWRKSRYHKNGESNFGKPINLWGVEVNGAKCCNVCWHGRVKDALLPVIQGLELEISKHITGVSPAYMVVKTYACPVCNKQYDDKTVPRFRECCPGRYVSDAGFYIANLEAEYVVEGLAR